MDNPKDTLVLLVTCSRDETRRDLAIEVVKNLASLIPQAGLGDSFVIFDNASTYQDHFAYAPSGAVLVKSSENVGYWSAIKWVLGHRKELMGRDFKYIYLVESDLVHSDLRPLGCCERFLETTPTASSVRTQEFSVRWRCFFDKRLKFLPFHVTRSEVHLKNAITYEKAWFKPSEEHPGIFLSNMHAKLPALNRLDAMDRVFGGLSEKGNILERDFFDEMMKLYPHIGVYDGGLFHSLISRNDKKALCGSYSSEKTLAQTGYHQTRKASFQPIPADLSISRAA